MMMSSSDAPIFVRGMSRSGGTLLVTLLDAHPEIAMSYELYPTLLVNTDDNSNTISRPQDFLNDLQSSDATSLLRGLTKAVKRFLSKPSAKNFDFAWHPSNIKNKNFRTFYIRTARGGLERSDMIELLEAHISDDLGFTLVSEQLAFIEGCCKIKMQREAKTTWGLKCNNDFESYHLVWPNARFINIIRDGRDVLASQLNTGSFSNSPEQVGRSWSNLHRRFREFSQTHPGRTYEMYYEKLVRNPEQEVRKLCQFLKIVYTPEMLRFHVKDLTIYDANHLSMNRISKPIDDSQIGRWKNDLNNERLSEFYETAKDTLQLFGYRV